MIRLSILPNSPNAAYRQIFEGIAAGILSGEIDGGEALPPIRSLAKELGVSVITVRNAWEELEASGLIVTKAGSGCFAADLAPFERERIRFELIEGPVLEAVRAAKRFRIETEQLAEIIASHYD